MRTKVEEEDPIDLLPKFGAETAERLPVRGLLVLFKALVKRLLSRDVHGQAKIVTWGVSTKGAILKICRLPEQKPFISNP